jgi:pimeloyl-ACP methyl ester carboxylesterase
MYPFFFGPSRTPLFGIYHEGAPNPSRNGSVVLCHPLGHEYIRVHRAFRNLAVDLSRNGWHVLRFDYYGTGDSSGDGGEMRIARCLDDLDLAIDELKDMSGTRRVSLVGLRLGSTLAAIAASKRHDIDTLLAWDPVGRGKPYLSDLRQLHKAWLETRPWTPQRPDARAPEIIGFPMPLELERELMEIDLAKLSPSLARRVCVVLSGSAGPEVNVKYWRDHVGTKSGRDQWIELPAASHGWDDPLSAHRSLQPRETLDVILSVMGSHE